MGVYQPFCGFVSREKASAKNPLGPSARKAAFAAKKKPAHPPPRAPRSLCRGRPTPRVHSLAPSRPTQPPLRAAAPSVPVLVRCPRRSVRPLRRSRGWSGGSRPRVSAARALYVRLRGRLVRPCGLPAPPASPSVRCARSCAPLPRPARPRA